MIHDTTRFTGAAMFRSAIDHGCPPDVSDIGMCISIGIGGFLAGGFFADDFFLAVVFFLVAVLAFTLPDRVVGALTFVVLWGCAADAFVESMVIPPIGIESAFTPFFTGGTLVCISIGIDGRAESDGAVGFVSGFPPVLAESCGIAIPGIVE